MGLKRSDVFQSKYCAQADLETPVVVTIKHAEIETIKSDDGNEDKAVLYFERDRLKPMILNSGNWQTIEDAYGVDTDDWIGKSIEVYVDPNVMFGKKKVGGVRVRLPSPSPTSSAPAKDPGANGPTFGPAWATQLEAKVAALAASEPGSDLESLRSHVRAMYPDVPESVVAGNLMNWPRSVMPECQKWCTDKTLRELPF